jgi:hypothetical protein
LEKDVFAAEKQFETAMSEKDLDKKFGNVVFYFQVSNEKLNSMWGL